MRAASNACRAWRRLLARLFNAVTGGDRRAQRCARGFDGLFGNHNGLGGGRVARLGELQQTPRAFGRNGLETDKRRASRSLQGVFLMPS